MVLATATDDGHDASPDDHMCGSPRKPYGVPPALEVAGHTVSHHDGILGLELTERRAPTVATQVRPLPHPSY